MQVVKQEKGDFIMSLETIFDIKNSYVNAAKELDYDLASLEELEYVYEFMCKNIKCVDNARHIVYMLCACIETTIQQVPSEQKSLQDAVERLKEHFDMYYDDMYKLNEFLRVLDDIYSDTIGCSIDIMKQQLEEIGGYNG